MNGAPYSSRLEQAFGLDLARLVIMQSDDPDAPHAKWVPVEPGKVPEWIKHDPEVVGQMMQGYLAKKPLEKVWYRAIILPRDLPGDGDAKQ